MHARGSGEAARRAKRGQPLPSRAISHARGHLRVSRFAPRTTEKRETARSLQEITWQNVEPILGGKQVTRTPCWRPRQCIFFSFFFGKICQKKKNVLGCVHATDK